MVGISALLGNAFLSGSWMANSMSLPESLRSLVFKLLEYAALSYWWMRP